jgi:hypothetical protein
MTLHFKNGILMLLDNFIALGGNSSNLIEVRASNFILTNSMKNISLFSNKDARSSSSSSLSSFSSSLDILGSKVGVTFEALAIRQMWEAIDDDEYILEAPSEIMSWPIEFLVSSTLLDTQQLEELEAFISWQQDEVSISL